MPSASYVRKAIHTADHERLCTLLRWYRVQAGLRQTDVAERLDTPQSFVSKYEIGERRLDLIELRQICAVLGVPLVEFVRAFDEGE